MHRKSNWRSWRIAAIAVAAAAGLLAGTAAATLAAPRAAGAPALTTSASQDELLSVSCSGAGDCMAVGFAGRVNRPSATLAERWHAGRWQVLKTPSPKGVAAADLSRVSCSGPADCVAVGDATLPSDALVGLVERWDGRTWRQLRLPLPFPSAHALLSGVSCIRSGCLIVGGYADGGPRYGLIGWVRGSLVRLLSMPVPPHALSAGLDGVSCLPGPVCLGVGGQLRVVGANTSSMSLAEIWNGRRWRVLPTPSPRNAAGAGLGVVSCVTPARCLAVGNVNYYNQYGTYALNEVWAGGRWRYAPTAGKTPARDGWLNAVSCRGPGLSCLGIGVTSDGQAFAQVWNGAALRLVTARQVRGIAPADISCSGPARCVAVGSIAVRGQSYDAGAELWNGRTWRSLAPVNP